MKTCYLMIGLFFQLYTKVAFALIAPSENALDSLPSKDSLQFFFVSGSSPVKISGYVQGRFQLSEEVGRNDGFELKRARLNINGNKSKWHYRLNIELTKSPKLLDAFAGYNFNKFIKITFGQFCIPFSLENTTADRRLSTLERSQIVNALSARENDVIGNQNGRDVGAQLNGSFLKINEQDAIEYSIGYFNGSGINTVDNNNSKDVAGRFVIHLIKNLQIGGSYYKGFGRWLTGTTAQFANQDRIRYGGEIDFKYKAFAFQGEYIYGQDGTIESKEYRTPLNRAGWYAQAVYFVFPKKLQVIARYDSFDPNTADNEVLIGGSSKDASTYSVIGINYFFNDLTKLQVNYLYRDEQGKKINNNELIAQLQLLF